MAIVQAQGRGLEPLIEVLFKEKQLAQQKEELKIQRGLFDLQKQKAEAEQVALKGQEEAAMLILERMGRNAGVNPAAAPALVENLRAERELGMRERTAEGQISHWSALEQNDRDRIALQERIANAESEQERNRLAFEERRLAAQTDQANRELASRELGSVNQLAASRGITPQQAYLEVYGTSDLEGIRAMLEGERDLTVPERQQRGLTRILTGMGVGTGAQNQLNDAIFGEGISPQDFVRDLFARKEGDGEGEVTPETKATLFFALRSIFPELRLPPPPAITPGVLQRLAAFGVNFMRGVFSAPQSPLLQQLEVK